LVREAGEAIPNQVRSRTGIASPSARNDSNIQARQTLHPIALTGGLGLIVNHALKPFVNRMGAAGRGDDD
jgi:hypothetical protein